MSIGGLLGRLKEQVEQLPGVELDSEPLTGRHAYKAPKFMDRQFVNIEVHTEYLTVYLYAPITDINDPNYQCERSTDTASRIRVNNVPEIPYVMKLIKQAYDYQVEWSKSY